MTWLEALAQLAAIFTAILAAWAWGWYQLNRRQKRLRLEDYLKAQKEAGVDKGQKTVLHLVANLGMTEAEVMDAAFRSKKVERRLSKDKEGFADRLFLEYMDGG